MSMLVIPTRLANLGILVLLVSSFCFLHICKGVISEASSSAPNIVFILADDLGWYDVGFHGSEIKTPNIDRLAKEGVVLNNYYVQPICTPTRAAILTGKYPIHTGMQHYVIVGSQPYGLPLKEKTMAQHLKSMGYSTHAVGKWHLGFFKEDYLPTRRGFDSHLGYYLGKEDYFNHYSFDGSYYGYDFHQNGKPLWNQSGVYSTELFSSQAEYIIGSHDKSKPLFLYLAHQAVHSGNKEDPIQVPQKYIDRFRYIKNIKRREFAGVVSALDDSVGRVYQALEKSGLANNTILIFSTDNGGPTNGFDRNAACNWPLRGCKETLWQGGVRGVGFVHSPLLKITAYINNNMMHAVDWLPTVLSAVTKSTKSATEQNWNKKETGDSNVKLEQEKLDGIDQWQSISRNTATSRKEVLLNIDPIGKFEGIVVGDFKLLKGEVLHGRYDGWYPPLSSKDDQFDSFSDDELEKIDNRDSITKFNSSLIMKSPGYRLNSLLNKHMTTTDMDRLITEMDVEYKTYKKLSSVKYEYISEKDLNLNPSEINRINVGNVSVKCGPKPLNASTNCSLKTKPCLFHLPSDPCEYNNLANSLPGVVDKLLGRLDYFRSTMIPPGNKPIDPKGNPQLHGGVWQPWL